MPRPEVSSTGGAERCRLIQRARPSPSMVPGKSTSHRQHRSVRRRQIPQWPPWHRRLRPPCSQIFAGTRRRRRGSKSHPRPPKLSPGGGYPVPATGLGEMRPLRPKRRHDPVGSKGLLICRVPATLGPSPQAFGAVRRRSRRRLMRRTISCGWYGFSSGPSSQRSLALSAALRGAGRQDYVDVGVLLANPTGETEAVEVAGQLNL